jgi:hypothetical protein
VQSGRRHAGSGAEGTAGLLDGEERLLSQLFPQSRCAIRGFQRPVHEEFFIGQGTADEEDDPLLKLTAEPAGFTFVKRR